LSRPAVIDDRWLRRRVAAAPGLANSARSAPSRFDRSQAAGHVETRGDGVVQAIHRDGNAASECRSGFAHAPLRSAQPSTAQRIVASLAPSSVGAGRSVEEKERRKTSRESVRRTRDLAERHRWTRRLRRRRSSGPAARASPAASSHAHSTPLFAPPTTLWRSSMWPVRCNRPSNMRRCQRA